MIEGERAGPAMIAARAAQQPLQLTRSSLARAGQRSGVLRWRFGLVTPVASDSCNALALE